MSPAGPAGWTVPSHPAADPARGVLPVLVELIDDAALFPPGNAPMPVALPAHRNHQTAPYSGLLGRFVCPASRITELRAALDVGADPHHPLAGAAPIRTSVIADTGVAGLPRAMADVAADPRLVLEAVEVPLPPGVSGRAELVEATQQVVAALPTALYAYVELPAAEGWETTLDVLATSGRRAKLRTGGRTAAAFPTAAQLAAVLTACAVRQVPVKCSAGLHHALGYRDRRTGFAHHGFLNVLVAAAAAQDGADPVAALSERDGQVLAAQVATLDPRVRRLFVGFGSCSVAAAVTDLRALGLL